MIASHCSQVIIVLLVNLIYLWRIITTPTSSSSRLVCSSPSPAVLAPKAPYLLGAYLLSLLSRPVIPHTHHQVSGTTEERQAARYRWPRVINDGSVPLLLLLPAVSFAFPETAWRYVRAWFACYGILSNVINAEIRNKIYELALQHDAKPIKLKRKVGFPVRSNPEQSQHAALTRVCQQIRHEYRPCKPCSDGLDFQELTQSCSTAASADRF